MKNETISKRYADNSGCIDKHYGGIQVDLEKFKKLVENPNRSKDELLNMRTNAIRQHAVNHARVVEDVLNDRFPTWNLVHSRRGGSVPTDVVFRGGRHSFESEKDAYIFLLDKLFNNFPKELNEQALHTYFVNGNPAPKFAKTVDQLFARSRTFEGERSKYHRLPNGWFAKLVLSNKEKLDTLMMLTGIVNLPQEDWDWLPLEGDTYSGLPEVEFDT